MTEDKLDTSDISLQEGELKCLAYVAKGNKNTGMIIKDSEDEPVNYPSRVDRSNVWRNLESLVEKGLVHKSDSTTVNSNPEYVITAQGQQRMEELCNFFQNVAQQSDGVKLA